ncbi:MAG: tRNA (N(6)-L-threonylcarbamoyladenosine(37)-C(2))-methylthiotransferase MtaB [Clostridiales bacterium]|nr:tRNA (N(6)-L-threonylcarbamoyladenosine(37)-C(2))-methylthiotransferase MtaB [Clostridiales bacterium]
MKKAAIYTLGCKVNQYETQAIKEKFIDNGYEIVHEDDYADVYIINTCTVTNLSDRKSRQYIRRAKRINPDSIVIVTGCYAQMSPDEIEKIEDVNLVVGTNEKNSILEYVEMAQNNNKLVKVKEYEDIIDYEEMKIQGMGERTRAYIKIQEGCNQFCSYCIIPYARGNIRSRAMDDIINEAKTLISNGYKEIVITGINAALYGVDNGQGTLLDVIENIDGLEGKFRIRLSSLEPAFFDDKYIDRLMSYKKLCSHIHLSVQSGSNRILKAMNRKYSAEEFATIVKVLRKRRQDMNITTDIIVGFPGETEKDFDETCHFVTKMNFGKVHVFKYSKRKGTKAADMTDQVEDAVKSKRSDILIEISDKAARSFNEKFINRELEVLFEAKNEKTGYFEGLTDNYIKVYCKSDLDLCDQFAYVKISGIMDDGLIGILPIKS